MRIAVWHNLPSGGGKRALHDHVRGLAARGHEIEVWCPPSANREYLPLEPLAREHVVPLLLQSATPAVGLAGRTRRALQGVHRDVAALEEHGRRCAVEISRGGFDLLLAHPGNVLLAIPPIAHHVAIPSVLYLHEPQRELYEARPEWPWIPPRLGNGGWRPAALLAWASRRARLATLGELARQEARNIAAYDRVLVNSHFTRETLVRAYGVDPRTCYLGIDTSKFAPSEGPREDFVVGLGAFTPAKNIELAIRALGRVSPPRPPLVWIGNASDPSYLQSLSRLAASVEVYFEPRTMVSEAELVATLGRAAMMLYTPRLEPFGYAPLEANACATPVVAVAEGGVRETVTDGVNGLLAEGEEELARAVERLRKDTGLARTLGAAGRKLVEERWSAAAAIDRLERHLGEAIAGARAPRDEAQPRSARR
jgi:glycosyltransferase involved in cell wall biosynthesis